MNPDNYACIILPSPIPGFVRNSWLLRCTGMGECRDDRKTWNGPEIHASNQPFCLARNEMRSFLNPER
jgi:hypothetical protein